jgi:hypothetical protein
MQKGLVLPSWLWCSCVAYAVKDLHVHRHMQINRGRPGSWHISS